MKTHKTVWYVLFSIWKSVFDTSASLLCCLIESALQEGIPNPKYGYPGKYYVVTKVSSTTVGLFSFGQSFIHHSSSLFCCLIEFWVFRSRCRLNFLGARLRSQPQYGRSRLPMARSSFGSSVDNVLTFFTDVCFCFLFLFLGFQSRG